MGSHASKAGAPDAHKITSDGKTVWVNGADGMCIGRFSDAGVDVHRTYAEQAAGMPQCLDCCHDLPFAESWAGFRASMQAHYGIAVDERHRPTIERFGRPIAGLAHTDPRPSSSPERWDDGASPDDRRPALLPRR